MPDRYLLGIDSGLTVTKAVVFDLAGRALGLGRCEITTHKPKPRHVERDMGEHWQATCRAIRQALIQATVPPDRIAAIGITGHGDGVYPVTATGEPNGPAMLSLDSRSSGIVEEWRRDGRMDELLRRTGQATPSFTAAAHLAWMKRHEPERYRSTRWVLFCKDWLRFRLTGKLATDRTEASSSFTDVQTQRYSKEVLELYGMPELWDALPPVLEPTAIAGLVTAEAAAVTGLAAGTPVVAGLHDVVATPIGMGCIEPAQLSLIAGTFSINSVLSTAPAFDPDWCCRNGFRPGEWLDVSGSPASATNIDWFVQQFCRDALKEARALGCSPFDLLQDEIEAAFARPSGLVYHPFLYGSPHGDAATAGFLGMQAWHERGHLIRALFEGIVFNHRFHVDALRRAFPMTEARLGGGGARSPRLSQLFADTLDLPVTIVDADEAGALGVALCAGIGSGCYADYAQAVAAACRILRRHEPDPGRHATLDRAYHTYLGSIRTLTPFWPALRATDELT